MTDNVARRVTVERRSEEVVLVSSVWLVYHIEGGIFQIEKAIGACGETIWTEFKGEDGD